MIEFGSDFHACDYPKGNRTLARCLPECSFYISGRAALCAILLHCNIKRIWIPSYYCYESLSNINCLNVEIMSYDASPYSDIHEAIGRLNLMSNDGLLVMNYFGINTKPDYSNIDAIVIEDHSHDLIGIWATESNADWCFASIRKTLPVPDGGVLWSPKQHPLPLVPDLSQLVYENITLRYEAMLLKKSYLTHGIDCKSRYLALFEETEAMFSKMPICQISNISEEIIENLDIVKWYDFKKSNLAYIQKNIADNDAVGVVAPCDNAHNIFSLVLLFENELRRNKIRSFLIKNNLYPAILWPLHNCTDEVALDFSRRMLSIHCDGRYSLEDMRIIANKLNESFLI